MSNEKPAVVVFQDDPDLMEGFLRAFQGNDITVLNKATNKPDALQVLANLQDLKEKEQLVDFVLALDMNLESGVYTGDDGKELLFRFREVFPSLVVYSISMYEYPGLENVEYVGADPHGLAERINQSVL